MLTSGDGLLVLTAQDGCAAQFAATLTKLKRAWPRVSPAAPARLGAPLQGQAAPFTPTCWGDATARSSDHQRGQFPGQRGAQQIPNVMPSSGMVQIRMLD
eukprot:8573626-Pyramimonas_sp.AAC.1